MSIIAVSSTSFSNSDFLKNALFKKFPNQKIIYCNSKQELSNDELFNFLKNSETAIIGKEKITNSLLKKLPYLKAISKYGVGMDNICLKSCTENNVQVFHEKGVNADAVAELAVGLMISILRNIALTDRLLHNGIWLKNGGFQLTGKKVAIIGCGHVGKKLAKLLKAFSCKILINDILPMDNFAKSIGAEIVNFNQALTQADVISLHVPLSNETKRFIGKKEFSLMKPSSILINTCRGSVVCEENLIINLSKNNILGAGIDVFENEPLRNKALYTLDNLVCTPHIAGNSQEAVKAMGEAAISGLVKFYNS